MRLSFKKKIIAALMIAVVGFAALGAVAVMALGNLSRNAELASRAVEAANSINEAQISVLTLGDDSRHLTLDEVDGFLTRVTAEGDRLVARLEELQEWAGDGDVSASVVQVADLITEFCTGLAHWVDTRARLGFDASGGLLARVAAAGDDLAESVSGYSTLSNKFFTARNQQQVFFLDRNEDALAGFREWMQQLKDNYEMVGMGDLEVIDGKPLATVYLEYESAVDEAAQAAVSLWQMEASQAASLGSLKARGRESQRAVLGALEAAQEDSRGATRRANGTILGGAAVVAAVLVAVLSWVGVTTTRRLEETSGILKDMATGDGDLTKQLPQRFAVCSDLWNCEHAECPSHGISDPCWSDVGTMQLGKGKIQCAQLLEGSVDTCESCRVYAATRALELDEFDRLSHWFNLFMGKVRTVVVNVKQSCTSLTIVADEVAGAAGEIAARTEEVSARAMAANSALGSVSSDMGSVTGAVDEADGNPNWVAAAAEQMAPTVAEIAKNASRASAITQNAVLQSTEASGRIQDLDGAAQKIGEVTATINAISEQTKLLALNATIEAARAGEAGKGFAVVANEVKELARQTADATGDIRERIEAMQTSTSQTTEDIQSIQKTIDEVNGIVVTIASAVEEQAITTSEIAENVQRTANGVRSASGRVASSSEKTAQVTADVGEVTVAVNDVSESTASLRGSAEGLTQLAGGLQEIVDRFMA